MHGEKPGLKKYGWQRMIRRQRFLEVAIIYFVTDESSVEEGKNVACMSGCMRSKFIYIVGNRIKYQRAGWRDQAGTEFGTQNVVHCRVRP